MHWLQFHKKSNRKGIGEVDINLYFGGVTIQSGDFIYADNNGIVIAKEKISLIL